MGHDDRRARRAGPRPPLHDLDRRDGAAASGRRRTAGRRGIRCSTARRGGDRRHRRLRRATTRSSGSARATRRTRAARTPARASTRRSTAARRGRRWDCPTPSTSRASSSIRPIPTSSTSPRWGISSRPTRNAASSGRSTAASTWKKVLYVNDHTGAIDLVMIAKQLRAVLLRRDVRQAAHAVAADRGWAGERHLQVDQRRRHVDAAQWRPPDRHARTHRPRHLSEESEYPLRVRREPESRTPGTGRGSSGSIGDEIYRTDDAGATWHKTHPATVNVGGKAPYSFGQIKIDPSNDQHVIVNSDYMPHSEDGGKTWGGMTFPTSGFFNEAFGDFRTMWWDEQDSQRILLGSDGGLQISFDGGKTSDFAPNLRIGEAYAVGVDMDDPYHVYAGFQDHDSWKGPVNGPMGSVSLENWVTVGPGDGMYNVVDPTDSRWVYNTRELGQMGRMDQKTGVRANIAPARGARASLQLDRARSRSRRTIRRRSTPARSCSTDRRIAAITGRRSARTSRPTTSRRSAFRARRTARSRRCPSRPSQRASSGSARTTARCS